MNAESLIKERRSVRKFADQAVPDHLMHELFNRAAVSCDPQMLQSMRLILALQSESKHRLSRYMLDSFTATRMGKLIPRSVKETMAKFFSEVPGLLVVVVDDHDSPQQKDMQYANACFFLQNLQLLAWEKGIGMFWRSDEILYNKPFFEQLGISDRERLAGILPFGFIEKTPRPRKRTPASKKWLCWPQI
ncbi:nitroreductase family protein [Fontibacillus sp. BL9]|uniref:nitroreductase family protein n=1 Tax=Fontibacillus sp. BL9 TaxID=3389971 RepID=UPI00397A2401